MRFSVFFFLAIGIYPALGQFQNAELGFVKYLIDKKQFDDAILVMEQKILLNDGNNQIDSLHYLLGKTYYNLQKLDKANDFLMRVSKNNAYLYQEATFLRAFNSAYLSNYEEAGQTLFHYQVPSSPYPYLKNFQLAGLALLRNDFKCFDSLKSYFSDTHLEIRKQQENFLNYRTDLQRTKQKSPLKAALLSATVPGLGRIYAGKKATGIYSIIVASLIGLQVYEAYQKDGPVSARFLIYGSLFTAFYIGNIWGSTLSIKMIRNEKEEIIRQQILFDMHIPLRTLF